MTQVHGSVRNEPINVKDAPFNAKGDGVTDDTAAIQAAIDAVGVIGAANAATSAVLIPYGTYMVSDSLLIPDYVQINAYNAQIRSTSITEPLFVVDASHSQIIGGLFGYSQLITDLTSPCIAIKILKASFCQFKDFTIHKSFKGLVQPGDEAASNGSSVCFSCSFENLRIYACRDNYIKLAPLNGGNTGNVFSNIYLSGATSLPNSSGDTMIDLETNIIVLDIRTSHEVTFNQLNIEWMKFPGNLIFTNSENQININGLHIEGIRYVRELDGLIRTSSKNTININGMTMLNCSIMPVANSSSLFKFGNDDSTVNLNGAVIRDFNWFTGVDGPAPNVTDFRLFDGTTASNSSLIASGFINDESLVDTDTGNTSGSDGKSIKVLFNQKTYRVEDARVYAVTDYIISGGVITLDDSVFDASSPVIRVDTEGGAATDDLNTINGMRTGQTLTIYIVAAGRDVTVKHAVGNIRCGVDFLLDHVHKSITLFYDGAFLKTVSKFNNT